ncbi:MAG: SDR family NAD(P)-dependent oxidoreductase [Gemmatimonadetes bacterium]|nr:SDR family NAD(P)-dependent oxidoreductase [Gemmatimonadota bacterium]
MIPRPLSNRRALVTGASRGIGAATARALASAGAHVAVTARTQGAIDSLVAELGPEHIAIVADIATDAGVRAVVSATEIWAAGAPDIIVNNAGEFVYAPFEELVVADFSRAMRLNVEAPFGVVRAFLAAMRARGSGDIVTVGSVADRTALSGNAAYSASKFGVRAVHEVLREETRGSGIRAILVSPGAVNTDTWTPHEAELGKTFPARDTMLAADDVARAICFAVSQPAGVNVEELRVTPS